MQVRLEKHTRVFELNGQIIGKGGEATVYESPPVPQLPALVAKIYHKPTPKHAEKLAAMIANPPVDPMAGTGHASIAWPLDRVFAPLTPTLSPAGGEGGVRGEPRCLGYVMPRVDKARPIFEFYNPKTRLQVCPLYHYGYLVRTARNLAIAIHAIHEKGYVIGDLNESNILVTNQALVTMVDTDSFQVPDKSQIHRCLVGKPEYTPPELQGANFPEIDRSQEHDAFALGVLIFQLLMQGIHPFLGKYTGKGEPPPLGKRIGAGHWPYAKSKETPYEPMPHAPPFAVLPPPLQELMRRCFQEGHKEPKRRPTAAEWKDALKKADESLVACAANPQHYHHKGLEACPWCAIAKQTGRDPFPSREDVLAGRVGSRVGAQMPLPDSALDVVPAVVPTVVAAAPPPPRTPPRTATHGPRRTKAGSEPVEPKGMPVWPFALGGAALILLVAVVVIVVVIANSGGGDDGGGIAQNPTKPTNPRPQPQPWPGPQPGPGPQPSPQKFGPLAEEEITPALQELQGGDFVKRRAILDRLQQTPVVESRRAEVCKALVPLLKDFAVRNAAVQALEKWGSNETVVPPLIVLLGDSNPDIRRTVLDVLEKFPDERAAEPVARLAGDFFARREVFSTLEKIGPAAEPAVQGLLQHQDWQVRADACKLLKTIGSKKSIPSLQAAAQDRMPSVADAAKTTLRALGIDPDASGTEVSRLEGHTGPVLSVAVSPDGKRALSGSADKTLRLWDLEAGRQVRAMDGHTGAVQGVAFLPDGKQALSGSEDQTIKLWDLETGQEVRSFKGHTDKVNSVVPSSDGRKLLSAGADGTLRTWDLGTGKEEKRLVGHVGPVNCVTVTATGLWALSGGSDGTVRVWNMSTLKEQGKFAGTFPVLAVAFSPDGTQFAYSAGAGVAWQSTDLRGGSKSIGFGIGRTVTGVAFSTDGKRAFACYGDKTWKMWETTSSGTNYTAAEGHEGNVICLAASPDGQHVLTGSADKTLRLWAVQGSAGTMAGPRPKPKPIDPTWDEKTMAQTYLSDLEESDAKVGWGKFGKKGQLGYAFHAGASDDPILVNGKKYPEALSMHPGQFSYSSVKYRLGKTAKLFRASVAVSDNPLTARPVTPVTFRVLGDGERLWSSEPMQQLGLIRDCRLSVADVDVLELQVHCPGDHTHARAVWLEPCVFKSGGASSSEELAGVWEGMVEGHKEVLTIKNDRGKWSVQVAYLKDGQEVGSASGRIPRYEDGAVNCVLHIDKYPPGVGWLNNAMVTLKVSNGKLSYQWRAGGSSGDRTMTRAAGP